MEFEFHISPAPSSSRPHTGVGASGTSSSSRDRLEDLPVQANRVTAGTEREPVQVDSRDRR